MSLFSADFIFPLMYNANLEERRIKVQGIPVMEKEFKSEYSLKRHGTGRYSQRFCYGFSVLQSSRMQSSAISSGSILLEIESDFRP